MAFWKADPDLAIDLYGGARCCCITMPMTRPAPPPPPLRFNPAWQFLQGELPWLQAGPGQNAQRPEAQLAARRGVLLAGSSGQPDTRDLRGRRWYALDLTMHQDLQPVPGHAPFYAIG